MEDLNYIEELIKLTSQEDVLGASRNVNELRGKFEDYTLEEERKIQVAELEAQDANKEVDSTIIEHAELIKKIKDDFHEIFNAYREKRKIAVEEKNSAEAKNLGEKIALIKKLKEVVSSEENIGAAFSSLKEIQEKWKTIGAIPRNKQNDIESEYSSLLDDFFYNIKIYKELKDHDFHRNHQLKLALIEQLKQLNGKENIREVESQLKKLQEDWNDIGPVPNETWETLKESYWTEVRSIYNKINRFYDDKRAQLQENLKQKEVLVENTKTILERIGELNSVKDWDKSTKLILEVQASWKKIGFGPKKENEAIWKKFRSLCDEFFTAKKAFFSVVNEEYKEIAAKKIALIDRAKELSTSTDWKNTANALKQLQQQWKKLGHAGVKNEQRLWKDFRSACDAFFNARSEHFNAEDKSKEENLKAKKALLKEIESHKLSTDKKEALKSLKDYASSFNAIGHVPLKEKDAIFKSFKESMDKHYSSLKMEGAEKDKILFEAKIDTIKSSPNAFRLFRDLKNDLRKDIDKQTKEITLLENNLGFFANSKGAESLRQDVEKKVNQAKDRIEEMKAKLKMIPNE